MKCDDVEEWISLSLDGELDAAHEIELNSHLESCEACAHRQKAWATQVQLLQRAGVPEGPKPEAMWQDVRREIRLYEDSRKRMGRRIFFQKASYALAACLTVGLGLYFAFRSVTNDGELQQHSVEMVETNIEGAMTVTWTDEESGLTVIWVDDQNGGDGDAG